MAIRYHSVRLDAVHYCDREVELANKRKHRLFFERNGIPMDAAQQRLQLFCQTIRSQDYLAALVHILKMPYMTRETCKGDLARTISALPNLRYVDLPDGFYSDDPTTTTLKQELQQRCPQIRRMKYQAGSETSFMRLAHAPSWQNLETLEVIGLQLEPDTLLYVLASFPALCELKLAHIQSLDDTFLTPNVTLPSFPPVKTLTVEDLPSVTAAGLVAYLARPTNRETLETLQLSQTGVTTQTLHEILAVATHLSTLIFNETVSRSFPLKPVPPLASISLKTLHYEITPSSHSLNPPSDTYYTYLLSSLLSSSLPCLSSLFVLYPMLPELLLAPLSVPFAPGTALANPNGSNNRPSASSTITPKYPESGSAVVNANSRIQSFDTSDLISPLYLYTKPATAPELEWSLTIIDPPNEMNGRIGRSSTTRPMSLGFTENLINRGSSKQAISPRTLYGGMKLGEDAASGITDGFLRVPNESSGLRPGYTHDAWRVNSGDGTDWLG